MHNVTAMFNVFYLKTLTA